MRHSTCTLLLASVAALTGCEEKSTPSKTGNESPAAPAPRPQARRATTPAPPPHAAKPTGRDVKKLEACEIVTGADVAKITGGKLISPSNTKGTLCGYVLERDGKTISYQLTFWEPRVIEPMLDAMSTEHLGEKVDGPWSIGFLDKGLADGTYTLSAAWRGDVAMEAQGDGKEPVIALAKLAASRLPPR